MTIEEIKECRLCHEKKLETVLNLGSQYVVDFVSKPDTTSRGKAPLELVRCENCCLVQLRHTVNQGSLYETFWYKSDCNEQMSNALKELAETTQEVARVGQGDKVLDIGCNNGLMLGWFPGVVRTVGVDPCKELVEEGLKQKRMDIGLIGYFSEELVREHGPFKAITAAGMFYDVPDPVTFLNECAKVMTKDGVLIIQMNYLVEMLNNFCVDNACHEHLGYYSLMAMKTAAERASLEIVGAEVNEVNGGSIRIYMTRKDSGLNGLSSQKQLDLFMMVMKLTYAEMKMGLDTKDAYKKFQIGVEQRVNALRNYLVTEAKKGERIYIYGASTRGTVLMQLLNLPEGVILGAAERDSSKFGLHMVGGTWPKIYDESYCRARATQFLVLPWHYEESVTKREYAFLVRGGKLIFPLPSPRVITDGGRTQYLELEQSVQKTVEKGN